MGKGFRDVYNLKGGIKAWQGFKAAGLPEMGMMSIRGDETEMEILILAYGMESGLESFYGALSRGASDPELIKTLDQLSRIEATHQQRLFEQYQKIEKTPSDREAFESRKVREVMEGGFTTGEFLKRHSDTMKSVPEILSIAMMLETQALDLYLRFTHKLKAAKSKEVLYGLADEEKSHLDLLGRLMDQKI